MHRHSYQIHACVHILLLFYAHTCTGVCWGAMHQRQQWRPVRGVRRRLVQVSDTTLCLCVPFFVCVFVVRVCVHTRFKPLSVWALFVCLWLYEAGTCVHVCCTQEASLEARMCNLMLYLYIHMCATPSSNWRKIEHWGEGCWDVFTAPICGGSHCEGHVCMVFMCRVTIMRRDGFTDGSFVKCATLKHAHIVRAVTWTQDWRGPVSTSVCCALDSCFKHAQLLRVLFHVWCSQCLNDFELLTWHMSVRVCLLAYIDTYTLTFCIELWSSLNSTRG